MLQSPDVAFEFSAENPYLTHNSHTLIALQQERHFHTSKLPGMKRVSRVIGTLRSIDKIPSRTALHSTSLPNGPNDPVHARPQVSLESRLISCWSCHRSINA